MPILSTKPDPQAGLEVEEECFFPCWKSLPDHLMLHIFGYLDASGLATVRIMNLLIMHITAQTFHGSYCPVKWLKAWDAGQVKLFKL